jgi:plasmid stability protein
MTLTLRDIPSELDAALRAKADEQHRSVDQVAVEALKAGLGLTKPGSNDNKNTSLAAVIRSRFGPLGGVELAEPIRDPMRGPLDLDE